MWMLGLQLVVICALLQVPGCFPSCIISGSVALCGFKNLRRIPPLPSNITHLYLDMNYIGEINSTSLSGLENLQELDLGLQRAPLVIRNNAFSSQSRLRRLVLGINVDLRLEPEAFVGLSALKSLDLSYCSLQDDILKENYLEPLSSLESLNLFGNKIKRIQPGMFFTNMTEIKKLNLKLNIIDQMCEPDLAGFQGKHFTELNLDSALLRVMHNQNLDWQRCGNPFRGMSFHRLDMSNNGFSLGMMKQFFKAIEGTPIKHLILSEHFGKGFSFNNLPDPDRSTFEGLQNSSVSFLDLSKNRIFALKSGVFRPLKGAVVIDVSRNRLNQIHSGAFEGLQGSLTMLNLSHNLLGEITSQTFSSLSSLRVLDLSQNHIGKLGFGSFLGLHNLRALFLTGNSLRDLDFPTPLPELQHLLLDDNKLTSSSVSSVAKFAHNVTQLSIRNNRLTNLGGVYTLTQLTNLKNLFYGGNTIRLCSASRKISANNLQILDLRSSSLQSIWSQGQCLDLFDNLGNLLGLDLSFNALQSLPRGIFKGLTSLVELNLSFNSLTYLQPDTLPKTLTQLYLADNFIASPDPAAFNSLAYLDLRRNRFHCDQNLKGFLTWLSTTNVTFLSPVEELRCEFPPDLHNVTLLDYSARATQ